MRQIVSEVRTVSTTATSVNLDISLPALKAGQLMHLTWASFDNLGGGSVTFLVGYKRMGSFVSLYESAAISSGGGRGNVLLDCWMGEGDTPTIRATQTGGGQDVEVVFNGHIDLPEPLEVCVVASQ